MKIARRVFLIPLVAFVTLFFFTESAIAAYFTVGYGSTNVSSFVAAFNRIGGSPRIGYPTNAVHTWGAGCIQDFSGGWSNKGAIMQANCIGNAYYVVHLQWGYIERTWGGNAVNIIGYPSGDDFRWGNGWAQHFSGGNQGSTTLARADQGNIVRQVWGGVRAYWLSIGGAGGAIGYPLSEEYAWNGIRRQDFQGGSILWDSVNKGRLLSRETNAVNYVIGEKNSATPAWSEEFGRYWSGYCEGFVEIAFGTRGVFASATSHYNWQVSQGQIRTDANPPAGAIVFYGGGGGYGHVGISIGNGQVISTQGLNRQKLPVWQHYVTGLSNPYLGWAYAPSSWKGR